MSLVVQMNRRMFLKGAGACIALPYFESLAAAQALGRPQRTRYCFLYIPNGVNMADWRPQTLGPLPANPLPSILRPLSNHLENLCVATGLDNKVAEAQKGDGFGEHARSSAGFLSAVHATQPNRDDLRAGTSIDVLLAQNLQGRTKVPLLNLGTEHSHKTNEESYSEVFNDSISWKNDRTPIQPIISPQHVFELLFGDSRAPGEMDTAFEQRRQNEKSILDSTLEASRSLQNRLNPNDQRVLDEFLESVRAVEKGMETTAEDVQPGCIANPADINERQSYEELLNTMMDLLVLAFRCDITRIATLMFGSELSYRDYGFLSGRVGFDMAGSHHAISHHRNNPTEIRKIIQINTFHTQQLAKFLDKLKKIQDGEGNLLDQTLIVYGASMADGNTHEHRNLPILLAGKGNGLMNPGKHGFHVEYGGRPMSNLYLTLLQKRAIYDSSGNVYTSFGDSGGPLDLPGGN